MKNRGIMLSFLMMLVCSLLLAGCFSSWEGEGTFSISVGGQNSRAVSWPLDADTISSLNHNITLRGSGPEQTKRAAGSRPVQFSVAPGDWDISVSAYLNNELVAVGFLKVNIKAGENGDFPVKMGPVIHVEGVTLSPQSLTIAEGKTASLAAEVFPSDATNKAVTWQSGNTSVATVSAGTVTAVAAGSTTVTVTTVDGGFTARCSVTVTQSGLEVSVTGVTLNRNTLTMTVGGNPASLIATVSPQEATNKAVTWQSSDTSIATVSGGTVTAVAAGSATVTVTTVDGGFTASCSVTVTPSGPVQYTLKVGVISAQTEAAASYVPAGGAYTFPYGTIEVDGDSYTGAPDDLYEGTITSGDSATVTAIPGASGFTFVKWVRSDNINGTQESTDNPYTCTISGNTSLYAVFDGDGASAIRPSNIASVSDLQGIGSSTNNLNRNYRLMTNLALPSTWTPIGNGGDVAGTPFRGFFDGNGFTITMNSTIAAVSAGSGGYAGLFGGISGSGIVKNLRLEGSITASFSSANSVLYVGAVTGLIEGQAVIRNVASAVSVTATGNVGNGCYVGGIAGSTGGAAGIGSSLENCYSTGSVTSQVIAATPPGNNVGGIAGASGREIQFCWAEGAVSAASGNYQYAGGISGNAGGPAGSLSNCVSLNSSISVNSSVSNVGRVAGQAAAGINIQDSFANSAMQLSTDGGANWFTPTSPLGPTTINGADFSSSGLGNWTATSSGPGWTIESSGNGSENSPWEWRSSRPRLWFE